MMSTVTFHPARLKGSAPVPPAKSEAHRVLLLAALGHDECRLNGFPPPLCEDTSAMIAGVTALGAKVTARDDALLVTPAPAPVAGAPLVTCDVRACAAALRMLIPAFLVRGQSVRFLMREGLFNRPMDAFAPLLKAIGGRMERTPARDGAPCSLTVSGVLRAGEYSIDGSQSSQFASGLLIALSHAQNAQGRPAQSFLTVTQPIVSRPYLDMTLRLMERFGLRVTEGEEGFFTLAPRVEKSPAEVSVSGDWSQAAVFLCANAMGGGVMIQNLPEGGERLQGDARIADVLERMGLRMLHHHGELYAVCPSHAGLTPVEVDCSDIPDVAPILALCLTQARGTSVLRGVKRLHLKECDRLAATVEMLSRLGAKTALSEDGDALAVTGPCRLTGGFEADARDDHRMVMFLAVAALIADGPIAVRGAEALNKSWPGFLDAYRALGGEIS